MMSDYRLYRQIIMDMDRHALDATEDRVRGWEAAAEDLRRGGLSEAEQMEECGWRGVRDVRGVEGLDLGWSFDKAWGKKEWEEEPDPLRRRVSEKRLKRPSRGADGGMAKRGRRS